MVLVWGTSERLVPAKKKKPRTSERFVANCGVGQRWSALSWGSAVGLKVSARCSDVCTVVAQAMNARRIERVIP